MSSIVELLNFKQRRDTPTLVLVDLHRATVDKYVESTTANLAAALANCRAALGHARARRMSIAFVRPSERSLSLSEPRSYPQWLEGFAPIRVDMVFDRSSPSCYASSEFGEMAGHIDGNYVLAGLFGETSCLTTAIEAFHRNHNFTYLVDASTSRGVKQVSSVSMHESVAAIISLYGTVATTQSWIRATSSTVGVRG